MKHSDCSEIVNAKKSRIHTVKGTSPLLIDLHPPEN